jgi:hypothetical protein
MLLAVYVVMSRYCLHYAWFLCNSYCLITFLLFVQCTVQTQIERIIKHNKIPSLGLYSATIIRLPLYTASYNAMQPKSVHSGFLCRWSYDLIPPGSDVLLLFATVGLNIYNTLLLSLRYISCYTREMSRFLSSVFFCFNLSLF